MSESSSNTTVASLEFDRSMMYWRLSTIGLAIAFVIAVASHTGPSSASASTGPNLLKQRTTMSNQHLSIGGFDAVDGVPMFVIFNQDGQRVGSLPMTATAVDD